MGASWLYFGCRRRDEDFLYESDLRAFETDGTLTRLRTAFSREAEQKVRGALQGGRLVGRARSIGMSEGRGLGFGEGQEGPCLLINGRVFE